MQPVCDHRVDVESALQQHRHLAPGLVHFAAVNTADGEHVKDHRVPIDCHLRARERVARTRRHHQFNDMSRLQPSVCSNSAARTIAARSRPSRPFSIILD